MKTNSNQRVFSAAGGFVLFLLIAAGAFLFIRNANLRADFERVQVAGYIYKADELSGLAQKRHPEAKIILNSTEDLKSKNDGDATFTLTLYLVIGGKDEGDSLAMINHPSDVIADKAGNIYVAEFKDGLIKKFSAEGQFIAAFGGKGQGPGELSGIFQMAFDRDDRLIIYDFANKRLSRFTKAGDYLSEIKIPTTYVPAGFAIDDSNDIYLSFYDHRRDKVIHKYSPAGERLASFGSPLIFESKPSFNDLSIQNRIAGGSIFLKAEAIWFSRRNPYEIMQFSRTGDLLMTIYRDNDFSKSAEMKIVGKNRYGFPIPSMTTMIHVYEDKIINWYWLPERQSPEIGAIIDVFDLDGRLVQSIRLSERIWAYSMGEAGRIYGTRITRTGQQVVRCLLK